jgi:endonuclease/exonuclease/phosphatase family metal-dependent hydrolase
MLFCTYNIHYGVGVDGRYDLARIADAIAKADIICIQEAAAGWHVNGYAHHTAEIAAHLNCYHWYHGAMDADASEVGDDGRIINRRRSFGNAVISRWPISWARGHLLPKTGLVAGFDLQRGFVEAVIEAPSGALRVHSVHLSHVGTQQRLPQIRAVMDTVLNAERIGGTWDAEAGAAFMFQERAPEVPRPAIVAGDFNFTPAHPEYPLVCGELTGNYGRLATTMHLADAWTAAGNDENVDSSPREGRIDHVFVTHDLAPKVKSTRIGYGIDASDHYPVFVEFDMRA